MKTKSIIALLMGIIILVVDLYWMYASTAASYTSSSSWSGSSASASASTLWLALGIIILIADIIWLYIDYSIATTR